MINYAIVEELLSERPFWFITIIHEGKQYFLKKYNPNVNGAYWTTDFDSAAGYLNEEYAVKVRDKYFKNRPVDIKKKMV